MLLIINPSLIFSITLAASVYASSLPVSQQPPTTNIQFNTRQQQQQFTNQMIPSKSMHQISAQQSQQPPATSITQSYQANALNNPYTLATHSLLLDLRQQLITRALKFDEHFRSLLSSSKISLHNMFVDTYGTLYQQNSEIFTSMYESLEQYYATGQIQLTKSMQEFFVKLYQKIFQAYNLNRIFTPEYMTCATEQLEHLKPFKDAPEKLIGEIRHAFVAARAFNQALNSGIDVIKNIISLGQPLQCTNLINERLLKHADASGVNSQVPCLNYCEQVISRCIGRSNLDQLNERWKAYVMAIGELAKKLSVHYNIETIIEPLDLQISEAIMNFQDNATDISARVIQACGPSTGTTNSAAFNGPKTSSSIQQSSPSAKQINMQQNRIGKRAAPASVGNLNHQRNRQGLNTFHQFEANPSEELMPSESGRQQQQQFSRQKVSTTLGRSTSLVREMGLDSSSTSSLLSSSAGQKKQIIVNELKDFMLSTRLFWSNLPNSVCTNNGSSGAFMLLNSNNAQKVVLSRKPPNCFEEHLGLSDMNSDLRYRTEIQQQAYRLSQIQAKINDALRGIEIDWTNGQNYQQRPSSINTAPAASGASYHPGSPSTPSTISSSSEDESEEEEDWNSELGSGDGNGPKDDQDTSSNSGSTDDSTTPDDSDYQDGDDSGLDSTAGIDDDYPSSSSTNNNNGDNDDTTTQQPSAGDSNNGDQVLPTDNSLDTFVANQPQKTPVNLDIPNDLITAPDAQKSGADGCYMRLSSVISSYNQFMLLALLLSITSLVTAINCQHSTSI